jgi:hypothetical protein
MPATGAGSSRPVASSTIGISAQRSGGAAAIGLPCSSKDRVASLPPISTAVEIVSRPWIPSRVGRTISDMSSHMPSQLAPPNRPR